MANSEMHFGLKKAFPQLRKIHSTQGREQGWAEGRSPNKNQGYHLFSFTPERKYFKPLAQKWEAVSRNVVLLPNTFIFQVWLRGCLFPTSPPQHCNRGTGHMNCSRGMLSTDLFWQQSAETLDSSSTCKAQNTSQDKAASRKGVHLLPAADYFPSVVLPDV